MYNDVKTMWEGLRNHLGGWIIMVDAEKYYNQEQYYDGIPSKVAEHDAKLSLAELESELEVEEKRCDEAKSWDELK
jgi:hypothetical protein